MHRGDDFWQRAQRGRNAVELSSAVIGDHDRGSAFIRGAARVVTGEDPLDDQRARPQAAYPSQIVPRDRGAGQRRADVDEVHRPLPRDDHVRQLGQAAVAQETGDPGRTGEHLGKEREFFPQATAQQFFHAIAVIPFAQSRHRICREHASSLTQCLPWGASTRAHSTVRTPLSKA